MKPYEFLLILSPQFSDEELPGVLDGIFNAIKKEGGEIKQHKVVGRQPLAYPINHMKHGCYVLAEIEIESLALPKVNRDLRLMPEILRLDISKDVSEGKKFDFQERKVETQPVTSPEVGIKPVEVKSTPEPIEEPKPAEETAVDKDKVDKEKISLEDLDKKLEEILNEEVL
ncbi:MAG: 30S ribosomal protein S6 [Patescibacteria group bacterium]|nr:30S ribosomal protein S6 [Patescibacteria group bacterium]